MVHFLKLRQVITSYSMLQHIGRVAVSKLVPRNCLRYLQNILLMGKWDWSQYLNTSHKFWDQSPSSNYKCCLQVSETVSWPKLRCCYSANILQHWVGGRGLIYFCKVDHSRISINFSKNWVDRNNLCEILSQNLRKLGE